MFIKMIAMSTRLLSTQYLWENSLWSSKVWERTRRWPENWG